MATKNNPGNYDCYANAEPDEPMFVLLGRHWMSSHFVAAWAHLRCGELEEAKNCLEYAFQRFEVAGKIPMSKDDPKIIEALRCAKDMLSWWTDRKIEGIEKRIK